MSGAGAGSQKCRVGIPPVSPHDVTRLLESRMKVAEDEAAQELAAEVTRTQPEYAYHYTHACSAQSDATPARLTPHSAEDSDKAKTDWRSLQVSDLECRINLYKDLTEFFTLYTTSHRVTQRLRQARLARQAGSSQAVHSMPPDEKTKETSSENGLMKSFAAILHPVRPVSGSAAAAAELDGLPPLRRGASTVEGGCHAFSWHRSGSAESNSHHPIAEAPFGALLKRFDGGAWDAKRDPLRHQVPHTDGSGYPIFQLDLSNEAAEEMEVYKQRGASGGTEVPYLPSVSADAHGPSATAIAVSAPEWVQPRVTVETYTAQSLLPSAHRDVVAEKVTSETGVRLSPVTPLLAGHAASEFMNHLPATQECSHSDTFVFHHQSAGIRASAVSPTDGPFSLVLGAATADAETLTSAAAGADLTCADSSTGDSVEGEDTRPSLSYSPRAVTDRAVGLEKVKEPPLWTPCLSTVTGGNSAAVDQSADTGCLEDVERHSAVSLKVFARSFVV